MSKCSDSQKGKLFSWGPMASGDLPAVQTHTRTDKCNLNLSILNDGWTGYGKLKARLVWPKIIKFYIGLFQFIRKYPLLRSKL
jgi:hypothetical protein